MKPFGSLLFCSILHGPIVQTGMLSAVWSLTQYQESTENISTMFRPISLFDFIGSGHEKKAARKKSCN